MKAVTINIQLISLFRSHHHYLPYEKGKYQIERLNHKEKKSTMLIDFVIAMRIRERRKVYFSWKMINLMTEAEAAAAALMVSYIIR